MRWKGIGTLVVLVCCLSSVTGWGQTNEVEEAIRLNQHVEQLSRQGKYTEAGPLAKRALAIREKALGPEHPHTATSLNTLAFLYWNMGVYAQALPLYQRALAIQEKALGPEHPHTATSLHNLARVYQDMKEYAQALPLYQRALAIREKVLGPEHPDTATALNNLAVFYHDQKEYAQALPLYQRALAIQEKALGPEHPHTATSLHNLARVYQDMKEYAQALPLYQRALAIREKVLGPEHPDTAIALNNLGWLYWHQGKYAQALPFYQRVLAIQEKARGLEHPDTASALNNLARVYQDMKEYTQALPLYQRVLAIQEKARGPEHPDTASALNNLARVYNNMREYTQALPLYQRALRIREKALGSEHPDTTEVRYNLAKVYQRQGEYAQALLLHQRTLAICEEVRGPEHPDTVIALDQLAHFYQDMKEDAKALPLYQRALAIREKVWGPEHPITTLNLKRLAQFYQDMKEYTQALPLYQRFLAIEEKVSGPEHPDTAFALNKLARVYQDMKEYTQALPLYQRALAIQEKARGPEHPDTATDLNTLARVYQDMKEYTQALPLYQRALAIQEKARGPEHPVTVSALNTLARVYQDMKEYTQALPLYQRALAIREKALGSEHPITAESLNDLGDLYWRMGEYAPALRFFERGLAVEKQTFRSILYFEARKQQLARQSQGSYDATLALIYRHFSTDADAVRLGLDLILNRKGIVLEAQSLTQETLATAHKGATLESWQRLVQHRSAFARLVLNQPEKQSLTEYRRTLNDLQAAINQEEEFLALHGGAPGQALTQRNVTAQILAERLPKESALVEFVRMRDWDEQKWKWTDTFRYLAFVLTPDKRVTLIDLGEAAKLNAQIHRTLAAIDPDSQALRSDRQAAEGPLPARGEIIGEGRNGARAYVQAADGQLTALYDLLLRPLAAALKSSMWLIVSPDGELSRVPFAALHTPEGQYLVEKMTISYVASGRDLLRPKSTEKPSVGLLLVANPAFDSRDALRPGSAAVVRVAGEGRKFEALPGTAQEAQLIPSLLKGTQMVLEGTQATEAAVRMVKAPKVLHLATHGFFLRDEAPAPPPTQFASLAFGTGEDRGKGGIQLLAPQAGQTNPMVRSGLALAGANYARESTTGDDGLLTALEVTGLNLYGTDLVVLSACQTGLGGVQVGEGVYGLRRAFVLAGARTLVMSLWPVDDKHTVGQMAEFYRAYGRGESPAQALRNAQLQSIAELRKQTEADLGKPLAPVKLWAPFLVQQTN